MSSNNPTSSNAHLTFHRTTDAVRISNAPNNLQSSTSYRKPATNQDEKLNDYLKRVVNSNYNSQIQPTNQLNIAPVHREGATNDPVDHSHVAHGPRTNHLSFVNDRYNHLNVRNSNHVQHPTTTTTNTQVKTLGLKSSVANTQQPPELKSNTFGPQGEKMASSQFIDAMGALIPRRNQTTE